ncbi:four-helix bundle copper-binding protein [Thalassobacillus devorans]|uniref:four-helix bundle copper-binding protein n=1 Tax=Thalassobacillus devorans TaxID=279813 RepID=UPI000A1CE03D|nr:four-helix bundle copper-binding protein [Thalassobacillus devorans]
MSHEKYSTVIETLHECMESCNHCYISCLGEEHVKEMAECIRLDRECADICSLFEQSLTRDTPYVQELAQLCAKACRDCGEECAKHDHDHCQKCAEACRKCADECEKLIA